MANILFMESGGDATGGFEFWASTNGTITVDTSSKIDGPNCFTGTWGTTGTVSTPTLTGLSNFRASFKFLRVNLPLSASGVIFETNSQTFNLFISTAGKLQVGTSSTKVTGTTTIGFNPYRISIAFSGTSTTSFTIKVFLDGVLEITATNADFTLINAPASITKLIFGRTATSPATGTGIWYQDSFYVDDGNTLDDCGTTAGLAIKALGPSALNTNNFNTLGGSGTNRYDRVSEVPINETNYIQHAAITDVQENFGIASQASAGLTGATILGRQAWLWGKVEGQTAVPITQRGTSQVPTGNPTTGGTVTIPATVAANDICLCFVTSRDSTGAGTLSVTDNEGAGTWVKFANSTDHKATVWWKRASANTNSKTLTVANAVGSCSFVLECYTNCVTSGDPFTNVVVETNAAGDESHAGLTPVSRDAMVFASVHNYANDNGVTSLSFATLGTTTATEKTSTGGSDCGCIAGHVAQVGVQVGTGTLTWAQTDGTTYSITFALSPQTPSIPFGSADIMDNGSETQLSPSTGVSQLFSILTTSSTYPTNAAAIGMRSSAVAADTYLYDCGMVIAYIPSSATTYNEAVADGAKLGDTLTTIANFIKSLSEGGKLGDSLIGGVVYSNDFSEGVKSSDVEVKSISILQTLTDGAKSGDSKTGLLIVPVSLIDTLKSGDSYNSFLNTIQSIAETTKDGDSITSIATITKSIAEQILAGEALVRGLSLSSSLTEGGKSADSTTSNLLFISIISDGNISNDTYTNLLTITKLLVEQMNGGDSVTNTISITGNTSDGNKSGDSGATTIILNVVTADQTLASDQMTGGFSVVANFADSTKLSDTLASNLAFLSFISEVQILSDNTLSIISAVANTSDTTKSGDTPTNNLVATTTTNDTIKAGDTMSSLALLIMSLSDAMKTGDQFSSTLLISGSTTESNKSGDFFPNNLISTLSISDGTKGSDTWTNIATLSGSMLYGNLSRDSWSAQLATDGIVGEVVEQSFASDQFNVFTNYNLSITETNKAGDSIIGGLNISLTQSEGTRSGDSIVAGLVFSINITEGGKSGETYQALKISNLSIEETSIGGDSTVVTLSGVASVGESNISSDSYNTILNAISESLEGANLGDINNILISLLIDNELVYEWLSSVSQDGVLSWEDLSNLLLDSQINIEYDSPMLVITASKLRFRLPPRETVFTLKQRNRT